MVRLVEGRGMFAACQLWGRCDFGFVVLQKGRDMVVVWDADSGSGDWLFHGKKSRM